MNPYLEEELDSVLDWNINHVHCQADHWYFLVSWLKTQSQKIIWNDPVYLVIPSAYNSIYLKVEDYKTDSRTWIDTEYKWEKMAVALILTSSCYQVLAVS